MDLRQEFNKKTSEPVKKQHNYKRVILLVVSVLVSIPGFLMMFGSIAIAMQVRSYDPTLFKAILDNYKTIPISDITPELESILSVIRLYELRQVIFLGGLALVIVGVIISIVSTKYKEVGNDE